jgi:hypothetical protein
MRKERNMYYQDIFYSPGPMEKEKEEEEEEEVNEGDRGGTQ